MPHNNSAATLLFAVSRLFASVALFSSEVLLGPFFSLMALFTHVPFPHARSFLAGLRFVGSQQGRIHQLFLLYFLASQRVI